jgi:hypothetical protein
MAIRFAGTVATLIGFSALLGCSGTVPQHDGPKALVLSDPIDHHDWTASEPMVVQHPNGTLFVSGYSYSSGFTNQRPLLWSSGDGGSTWSRVNVGTEAQGAVGNSDVDLAVAPDGTLYFANLGYGPAHSQFISMGVSRDAGATWSWSMLSKEHSDRPWVAVTPDGSAHAIWSDPNGVHYAATHDRGATWTGPKNIFDRGGSSHLAAGPHGELAAHITPMSSDTPAFAEGVDLVAVSTDGGSDWRTRPAPGHRSWDRKFIDPSEPGESIPRWVEPLAWDASGALFSLWTDEKGVQLARSTDQGESWTTWEILPATEVAYYPYLTAGPRAGELAATWFSGRANAIQAHLAVIQTGSGAPHVIQSRAFQIDCWQPGFGDKADTPVARTTSGEYLAVIFLRSGGLGVVSPLFNLQTKRAGFSWRKAEFR